MFVKIKYAEGYRVFEKPVNRRYGMLLPGQGQNGYGAKITTHHCVQFYGESRVYRVYATCYSNVSSHWIMKGGEKLHIR